MLTAAADAFGQDKFTLRGRVLDKETGESVIGCNVIEYDKDKRVVSGTITDVNGYYTLGVRNANAIIMFSFIGYDALEVPLDARTTLNVEMEAASFELEEIVIIAEVDNDPLTNVSRRDITSSRVKVDMSDATHIGAVSADEALQGKVSGLDILSSGDPGSGSQIVIRGMGSLGNSQPLIVIDGVPQSRGFGSGFDFGSADQEDIGNLINIAPQDIKSIEVLKDAASAAQWGTNGADGVLIIKTHRGRKGKTRFDYQGKYTYNIQPPAIPMLSGDEYIMLQLEEWHNSQGVFEIPPEIAYDPDYVDFYNYSVNTNWVEAVTQTGSINEQYLKVSGGGEKTGYFASVNLHRNEGTTINTGLKRFTTRVNLDYNVSRKIRFSANFSYANSIKEGNYIFNEWSNNPVNIRNMAYRKAPNMAIWEYDESGIPTGEYFTPIRSYQGIGTNYFNPVAIGKLSVNDYDDNSVGSSFILNYNIISWLRFQQLVSYSYSDRKSNKFVPYNAIGADWLDWLNNFSTEQNSSNTQLLSRSQLFFSPRLGETHFVSGMLMAELTQQEGEWSGTQGHNGPSPVLQDPAGNPPISWIGSGTSEDRTVGFMGNLNYKLKDRYIASINMRVDGSSRFGRNNRWGLFPSLSAGWRFSEERWLQGMEFLSDAKLRFSWGITGKQPGRPYDRHAVYNTPSGSTGSQYLEKPIIVPQQIQLSNLKWQSISSSNLGLDLSMFRERLNLTAELYTKLTEDLLWSRYDIPLSSGYRNLKQFNGGSLQNQGWELFISTVVYRTQYWNINLNFNIAQNFNTFMEFPDNFNNEVDVTVGNEEYPRRADIGQPIGSFYGFRFQGVWPSNESVVVTDENGQIRTDANGDPIPLSYKGIYKFSGGDARYEDVNHDGNIDLFDVVYLGDSNPDFMGGFGTSAQWRGFKLNLHFHYRVGFQIVNEIAMKSEGMNSRDNQSTAVLHRWRAKGQDEPGLLPRAYLGHPANNLGSDRFVEDGDFLRLGNMTFIYSLNRELCRKLRLNSVDIAFTMRRVMTLTRYSGQDPEISAVMTDPFWFGTDRARTPPPKTYTLSIAFSF